MRVQRSTSRSMIPRYSATWRGRRPVPGRGSRPSIAATQALMVASGIVDLVHDAGGELSDRRELLALEDLALDPVPLGHVLADGDHVGDLVALEPHGDLAEPEEARLPAERHLLLGLLDLAGLEHPVELGPELGRAAGG